MNRSKILTRNLGQGSLKVIESGTIHEKFFLFDFLLVFCLNLCRLSCLTVSLQCLTLLGDRKGIRPVKNWMLVCWFWF